MGIAGNNKFDFDTIVDRRNTNSIKHDFATWRGKPEGVIPLWVADMDFPAPPCVIEALTKKANHGIFGYSDTTEEYDAVLADWFRRRFHWQIESDWLIKTPGIVTAIYIAIQAFTDLGAAVLIQQPVYHPFAAAIQKTNRQLVVNELALKDKRYEIDFDDFAEKIIRNKVKLFILCSPHNPVGRVWTKEELIRMGEICLRHNVLVIADEIHADIIYPPHVHHVFADLRPEFLGFTITCTAPSKTFNLAGLHLSNLFIANEELRKSFLRAYQVAGLDGVNIMGIVAGEAAYKDGEEWLEELNVYLKGNYDFLADYIAKELPSLKLIKAEGTYLAWLDFRKWGLSPVELDDFVTNKAGLWLNAGTMFGIGGAGFQRMNFACPRSILLKALEQLKKAENAVR